MKLKTLLLGSAATFMVVGGAQAADLTMAEPVDYVRVCDAIGVGYWYIPGTDTCLQIAGYVQFDINFHDSADVTGPDSDVVAHSASWDFVTEAGLDVTAKSMTEYGILTGFIALRAKSSNKDVTNSADVFDASSGLVGTKLAYLDKAYLELGPVLAGFTGSTYDYGGALSGDPAWRSDSKTDQIRLTWAMSGFGLMFGIEDPRDRWGTSLATSYSTPDIIAAITASQGNWDGKVSVGFAQLVSPPGGVWGVNAGITIKLDSIAPGDALRLNASVGDGTSFVGAKTGGVNGTTQWSAFASFQHFWSPTLSSAFNFTYYDPNTVTADSWAVGADLVWAPVTGFSLGGQVTYTVAPTAVGAATTTSSWSGRIRLKRYW